MMTLTCEGCDGSGVRAPATPSCYLTVDKGWAIVERCDTCQRFESDLAAAWSKFGIARWIVCANGGLHAIGRWSARSSNVKKERLDSGFDSLEGMVPPSMRLPGSPELHPPDEYFVRGLKACGWTDAEIGQAS